MRTKRPTTDEADRNLLADIAGAKAKHTPGPWCPFDNGNNTHNIISYGGGRTGLVGVTFSLPVSPEDNEEATEEANARLIAAAPDLLEACRELVTVAEFGVRKADNEPCFVCGLRKCPDACPVSLARAAIAKAEHNPTT